MISQRWKFFLGKILRLFNINLYDRTKQVYLK